MRRSRSRWCVLHMPTTRYPFPYTTPCAPQVCDDCLKTGAQTHTSTMGSFPHNHLLVSLCSQITPKSAPGIELLPTHRCSQACYNAQMSSQAGVHAQAHSPHHTSGLVLGAYRVPNIFRWLSSKKVETVRALLAGASQVPPRPYMPTDCMHACLVRRGSGDAVRSTLSRAPARSRP